MILDMQSQDRSRVQVVDKSIAIMVALSGNPKTVIELAHETHYSKTCIYRILRSLVLGNFVEEAVIEKKFGLTSFFDSLKTFENTRFTRLNSLAMPHMYEIYRKFNESVNLAVLIENRIEYLHQIESTQEIRAGNPLHDKDFAHSTALGKAILSGMSTEMANSKIDKFDFRRLTLRTITNGEDFKKIVIQARRVGYAIDDQENELGARCVAVAIFDNERFPIAAISVSGPVSRMDAEKIKLIVESLKRLSLTITESLTLK